MFDCKINRKNLIISECSFLHFNVAEIRVLRSKSDNSYITLEQEL